MSTTAIAPQEAAGRQVDGRFYEVAQPRSLGERLMIVARDRIHADFLRWCRPDHDARILDVGVSDVITDSANVLERSLPNPGRITAVGLGEGQAFRVAFPQVAYQQIVAGEPLPFADKSFDVAVSNAVIEHVGGPTNQRRFVAELKRVAKTVFISAPNAFFPVEHHTAIPLLHFWRPTFEAACRALGKSEWLDPANLSLISRSRLEVLGGIDARVGYTGLRLGPFSSNLYLVIEQGRVS